MNTNWKAIDFTRVEVISYDLGHTLYFPDYQHMSDEINRILGITIPSYILMQYDWREKQTYSTLPITENNDDFHYGDLAMSVACVAARELELDNPDLDWQQLEDAFRAFHEQHNFFRWMPPDAVKALLLLRDNKKRTIAISNANGNLENDMTRFGTRHFFEELLDSGAEGVAKPEREIFIRAADRCGVKTKNILHVGDHPQADVYGALNAGMQAALYDPQGMYPSVPSNALHFRNHVELVEHLLTAQH
jgi:HAD superfamily hydrolase (TIGR01549 family)